MTIISKVLCGFILLAVVPFFYLAAKTLKTHQVHRENYQAYEKAILAEEQIREELAKGKFADEAESELLEQGIRQAKLELYGLTCQRGRVWRKCVPSAPDPATGAVNLRIGSPTPHQIRQPEAGKSTSLLVYIFEERPKSEGGKYIGEFKVTGFVGAEADNVVTITPALPLNPARTQETAEFINRLRTSASAPDASWVLYDVMPIDDHEAFAGLQPDELTQLVPGESAEQYRRHGSPAEADDLPETVAEVDGQRVFQRPLRDYAVQFREFDRLATVLRDELDAYSRDAATIAKAKADSEQCLTKADELIAQAKAQLAASQAEAAAAADYLTGVEQERNRLDEALQALLADVQKLGQQVAERQTEALGAVEARLTPAQ